MELRVQFVKATNDTDRFNVVMCIASSGTAEENDIITEMIKVQRHILKSKKELNSVIKIQDNRIYFVDVPIGMCKNLLYIYKSSLDVNFNIVIEDDAKFYPDDCRPMFKMEVNQLLLG